MKTYIHKKFYIKLYKQNLFIANYQSKQKLETIEVTYARALEYKEDQIIFLGIFKYINQLIFTWHFCIV